MSTPRGKRVNWHSLFRGVGYSTLTPETPYYIRTERSGRTIIVPLTESELNWMLTNLQDLKENKTTRSLLLTDMPE